MGGVNSCASRKPLNREIRARVFGEGSRCGCTRTRGRLSMSSLMTGFVRCPAKAQSYSLIS